MFKVLIVGNGIAGLSLAWQFEQGGAETHVMADPYGARSTTAAAGVVNPVTGKRYAKSWRFEEHYRAAQDFYQSAERYFGQPFWRERPILRLLGSPEEANNWSRRAGSPEYGEFIFDAPDAGPWSPFTQPGHFFGLIRQAAQIDFASFTDQLVLYLEQKGRFRSDRYLLSTAKDDLRAFDAIVFCEGSAAAANPLFPNIPWQPAKGEGILVEFQDPALNSMLSETSGGPAVPMLKKEFVIAATQYHWNRLCWVGANYAWDFADHHPTPEAVPGLTESLKKMIQSPFIVKGQFAGIRQVTKDRRPVLGSSPILSRTYIFNGLGSKGGLQAPLWAGHLVRHVLEGTPLDPEVDIARFYGTRRKNL
jgi:glycine oxidase